MLVLFIYLKKKKANQGTFYIKQYIHLIHILLKQET